MNSFGYAHTPYKESNSTNEGTAMTVLMLALLFVLHPIHAQGQTKSAPTRTKPLISELGEPDANS